MLKNPKQNKGIKSGRNVRDVEKIKEVIVSRDDAGEPEIKKEGIESRSIAKEPEKNLKDRIRTRCVKTQHKSKRSNMGAMEENPKQNEGNKSRRDA